MARAPKVRSSAPRTRSPCSTALDVPVADQLKNFYDVWGRDKTYNHMAVAWTWAFDTPFKWTKQIASHFGGVRGKGMAISWPGHIKDARRHSPAVPSCHRHRADTPRSHRHPAPEMVDGIKQKPIEGVSMAYTFDAANANKPSTHKTQYFEMMGVHAIYHDGWVASYDGDSPAVGRGRAGQPGSGQHVKWELYNITQGLDAINDVAAGQSAETERDAGAVLGGSPQVSGAAVGCLRRYAFRSAAAEHHGGPDRVQLHHARDRHPAGRCPSLLNTSYTITADIEVPAGGAEGMLLTSGRPVWRLGLLSGERQTGLHLEFARSKTRPLGRSGRNLPPASTPWCLISNTTASVPARLPSTT